VIECGDIPERPVGGLKDPNRPWDAPGAGQLGGPLLPDGLWQRIQPLLLPPYPARTVACQASARLGRYRWTIERTGAWLGGFRRLRIRYERSSERFSALAMLACSVICCNALLQPPG